MKHWFNWKSRLASKGGASMEQPESLVAGQTGFALNLYRQLKENSGNLFFSPLSVSTCLAMAYAGARGNTAKEMSRALGFASDQDRFHAAFGELLRQINDMAIPLVANFQAGADGRPHSLQQLPGLQLDLANALWAQKGYQFLEAFLKIVEREYRGDVRQANFTTECAAVIGAVNQWIAEKTHDKIQNILAPGSLDASTRLVLANALYFKGAWNEPFEEGGTSPQPFHLGRFRKTESLLMSQTNYFNYCENKDFKALELPYIGNELSMLILLPRQTDGCGRLEDGLSPQLLSSTLAQMKNLRVEVHLPRFKLESSFDLRGTLAAMGMREAFAWPGADFSGLNGSKDLFISHLFHKAWGEVNENGTEAAAVTVAMDALGCFSEPLPPAPIFRADHPFIFFIRHRPSSNLLFAGRLADPRI